MFNTYVIYITYMYIYITYVSIYIYIYMYTCIFRPRPVRPAPLADEGPGPPGLPAAVGRAGVISICLLVIGMHLRDTHLFLLA